MALSRTRSCPHLRATAVAVLFGLVVLHSTIAVTCCSGDRGGGTTPGALGGLLAIRPTARGALLPPQWLLLLPPLLFLLLLLGCLRGISFGNGSGWVGLGNFTKKAGSLNLST